MTCKAPIFYFACWFLRSHNGGGWMCVHVYFVKVFQLCEVKIIFFLGIQNVMKICADIQSGALQ